MLPKCVAKHNRGFNAALCETVTGFATHSSMETWLSALESKQPRAPEPAPTKPVKPSAFFAGSQNARRSGRR